VKGHGVHSQKIRGNRPRGSTKGCQNVFVFSVKSATRPSDNLSWTDFDHFWNKRRESCGGPQ